MLSPVSLFRKRLAVFFDNECPTQMMLCEKERTKNNQQKKQIKEAIKTEGNKTKKERRKARTNERTESRISVLFY